MADHRIRVKDDTTCPLCGQLASDHRIAADVTIASGVKTIAEMRALVPTGEVLVCPPRKAPLLPPDPTP